MENRRFMWGRSSSHSNRKLAKVGVPIAELARATLGAVLRKNGSDCRSITITNRMQTDLVISQPGVAGTQELGESKPGMCRLHGARLDKGFRSTVEQQVAAPEVAVARSLAVPVPAEGNACSLPPVPEYERASESRPANRRRWKLLRSAVLGAIQERLFLKASSTCDKQLLQSKSLPSWPRTRRRASCH